MRRTGVLCSSNGSGVGPWLTKIIAVAMDSLGKREIPAVKDFKTYQKTTAQSVGRSIAQAQHFAQKQWEEFKSQFNSSKSSNSNGQGSTTNAHTSYTTGGSGYRNNNNNSNNSFGGSSTSSSEDYKKRWSDFTNKAYYWWVSNKDRIIQFVGANLFMILFVFQFGSEISRMLMQLVYSYAEHRQQKNIREKREEEKKHRQKEAEEVQEDLSDDVYSSGSASVGNNSMSESELRMRLERREKRRMEQGLADMQIHFHQTQSENKERHHTQDRTINERPQSSDDWNNISNNNNSNVGVGGMARRLLEEEERREVMSILAGSGTDNTTEHRQVTISKKQQKEKAKKRRIEADEEERLASQKDANRELDEQQYKQSFYNSFAYKMSDSTDEDHQYFGQKHDNDTQRGPANYNEYTNGSMVSFGQRLYSYIVRGNVDKDVSLLVDPLSGKPLHVTKMEDVMNQQIDPVGEHVFDFRNPKGISTN